MSDKPVLVNAGHSAALAGGPMELISSSLLQVLCSACRPGRPPARPGRGRPPRPTFAGRWRPGQLVSTVP